MIHLLLKGMRSDDCTAQASTWPFIVSVKRPYLALTQPLTAFFGCVGARHIPPVCGLRRTPVFLVVVSVTCAPHQSPIRLKAYGRLASAPDICPWHASCPRKPSVPYRVQACTTYSYRGSLAGPTFIGLTAEASQDSPIRWQAICEGLRPGLIRMGGC
jgi:hypothetical protein